MADDGGALSPSLASLPLSDSLHVSAASSILSSSPSSAVSTPSAAIAASGPVLSDLPASHLAPPPTAPPSTMVGWIGWIFAFFFQVIPSVLYWTITFSTITLPTWLFTLFSTSLTFTMNFTTL